MSDLKPCPFCGRFPVVEDCGPNRWFVRCGCGIAQDKLYHQRCDAVKAWNRRKTARPDTTAPTTTPTTDTISRQVAIGALHDEIVRRRTDEDTNDDGALDEFDTEAILRRLPPAQSEPISEEYAKAVRSWLINYQVRCAELAGRYTPYEILGWIVSDWRKENEIW